MNDATRAAAIRGEEHWTSKHDNVKLFMFEKCGGDPNSAAGTILFVHASSMASQPTFDLQDLRDVSALEILHRDEETSVVLPDIVDFEKPRIDPMKLSLD